MECSVVFANSKNIGLQVIRSYSVRSGPDPPFTILQAARATMASPDLFPSVYVGSRSDEFVAHFMNPINSILEEAEEIFDETTKVACILSLGSGTKEAGRFPDDPEPKDRSTILATIAEDCETPHQDATRRYGKLGIYHRINVERDLLYAGLDEWSDGFANIRIATRNYLQANVKSLDKVVDSFVRPVGGPTTRDLSLFYIP